jgi:hypothetical protein
MMHNPTLRIAKLNANRYEVSLENQHGMLKCWVRAKLADPKRPIEEAAREVETKQLALRKAKALATVLKWATLDVLKPQ